MISIESRDVQVAANVATDIGEGPTWDAQTNSLVFVDSTPGRIYRYRPAVDTLSSFCVGQAVGAAIPRRSGGLVAAMRDGIALIDEAGASFSIIAPIEADMPHHRMNDAKCDSRGRLWAGTMSEHYTKGAGSLYRIDPDYRVTRVVPGISISNGIAWSPDDKRMYYVDSGARSVDVFDFDIDAGLPTNRSRLITLDRSGPLPDGVTVDADGHLWLAIFRGGAVRRYTPSGEHVGTISLPVSQVASCAFGGPDLADLYITSVRFTMSAQQLENEPLSGALFRCRPGVRGLPAHSFAG